MGNHKKREPVAGPDRRRDVRRHNIVKRRGSRLVWKHRAIPHIAFVGSRAEVDYRNESIFARIVQEIEYNPAKVKIKVRVLVWAPFSEG